MAKQFDLNPNLLESKTNPETPLENVDYWLLVDTVSYSVQLCSLLQYILKPLTKIISQTITEL